MSVICYYSLWRYSCWEYCRNHPCIASGLFPGIQRRASVTSPYVQYRAASLQIYESWIGSSGYLSLNWFLLFQRPPVVRTAIILYQGFN
jgi:hypothetical protein